MPQVWIYGDSDSFRTSPLVAAKYDARVIKPHQLTRLLESEPIPILLWIRLPGPGTNSERRQATISQLQLLVDKQITATGHFIIEANRRNSSWQNFSSTQKFKAALSWCGMGIRGSDNAKPSNNTQVHSSLKFPANFYNCNCTNRSQHVLKLNDFQSVKNFAATLCNAVSNILTTIDTVPESIKESIQESNQANQRSLEASILVPQLTQSNTNSTSNTTSQSPSPSTQLSQSGTSKATATHLLPLTATNSTSTITDTTTTETSTTKLRALHTSAFPTESAIRQKALKELHKDRPVTKRKFQVEEHWDDCGEDTSAIHIPTLLQQVLHNSDKQSIFLDPNSVTADTIPASLLVEPIFSDDDSDPDEPSLYTDPSLSLIHI